MNHNASFKSLCFWKQNHRHPLFHLSGNITKTVAERLLAMHKLRGIYDSIPTCRDSGEFLRCVLSGLNIQHTIQPEDLKGIPCGGPTVVVANHPFGGIDGIILASILLSVRGDVKILANYFLEDIPELHPLLISVDPFGKKNAALTNGLALKRAFRWVKNGGLLVLFPAGAVSHFCFRTKKIEDPPWHESAASIIRRTRAIVVPVYFKGCNSLVFHAAGLIHPLLRTLMLPREMVKKQSVRVDLKIGSAISNKRIMKIPSDGDRVAYLRFRTYLLGKAFGRTPAFLNSPVIKRKMHIKAESIVAPKPSEVLHKEVEALPGHQRLISQGSLGVYMAFAAQIPNVLHEIGRLREDTFRRVGEGTGMAIDLDSFDKHYLQLFLWNAAAGEVVGGYRLAPTDEVLRRFGKEGLYTYTLFKYQTRLMTHIGPALEMSRSFVRHEYQKRYMTADGYAQFMAFHRQRFTLFPSLSSCPESALADTA